MKSEDIEIELREDNVEINIGDSDNQDINIAGDERVYIVENDYNKLKNQPQINEVTLSGNKKLEDLGIINDLNYVHNQTTASDVWVVKHNLNKYPSVTIVNSAGDEVIGDVFYDSVNQVTITFVGAFKGKATLN